MYCLVSSNAIILCEIDPGINIKGYEMRRRWFLIASFFLMMVLFAGGCGVSQDAYDAVVADLEKAQQELLSIKAELAASQSRASELKNSLEESIADLEVTEAELEAAKEELAKIGKVYPPRDFSSSTELRDWLAANDVSESSPSTIAETLYMKGLQIQEDALKDGYVISVDLDPGKQKDQWYITCVAIIDGDLWAWGPESDEPNEVSSMIDFMKVK